MSFYNPNMKGADMGGGIQDFAYQMQMMNMIKQMMQQNQPQQPPGVGQSGGGVMPQAPPAGGLMGGAPPQQSASGMGGMGMPGQGSAQMSGPQPTMGAGPPGMGQAGMAGQMGSQIPMQLMMALKDNPQLIQFIMQTLRGGQGGM